MYSNFPLSMDNIPRQKSFACLSLKFGCIISALIIILYTVLSLAQCTAALDELARRVSPDDAESVVMLGVAITVTILHTVTLFLTALMLVGTLREKPQLMRPWIMWTSIQVIVFLMMFIYFTTMNFIQHAGGNSVLLYVLEFVSLLLRFYMLMLVASYFKQLEDERYDGERLKTLVHQDTWYNSA